MRLGPELFSYQWVISQVKSKGKTGILILHVTQLKDLSRVAGSAFLFSKKNKDYPEAIFRCTGTNDKEGSVHLDSLLPCQNNLATVGIKYPIFCFGVWQVPSATQEWITFHFSRTLGNSWKGFTKLNTLHPEHLYIYLNSSQVTKAIHGKNHLNLYRSMCCFGKLPSRLKKNIKINYKQTKACPSPQGSPCILFAIVVLVLGWCMRSKGLHWGWSYRTGYHTMSAEQNMNSLRAENQCSLSIHWPNTDCSPAWHMTAHTAHLCLCTLSGVLVQVGGGQYIYSPLLRVECENQGTSSFWKKAKQNCKELVLNTEHPIFHNFRETESYIKILVQLLQKIGTAFSLLYNQY